MTRSHVYFKSPDSPAEVLLEEKDGELSITIGQPGLSARWHGNKQWAAQMLADFAAFWKIRAVVEGVDGNAIEPQEFG